MWIEIKNEGEVSLVNSMMISYICKSINNNNLIIFLADRKEVHLKCASAVDCAALIQGFILALNGLDFRIVNDEDSNVPDIYIKPLKDAADEALYKYLKLKEFILDRK